jgi:hypothetical protein
MRCVKTSSSSCERCSRVNRTCTAIEVTDASPGSEREPAPVRTDLDVTTHEQVAEAPSSGAEYACHTLPSIYSMSPVVNHHASTQSTPLVESEPQQRDESLVSPADTAQWLQMYYNP